MASRILSDSRRLSWPKNFLLAQSLKYPVLFTNSDIADLKSEAFCLCKENLHFAVDVFVVDTIGRYWLSYSLFNFVRLDKLNRRTSFTVYCWRKEDNRILWQRFSYDMTLHKFVHFCKDGKLSLEKQNFRFIN